MSNYYIKKSYNYQICDWKKRNLHQIQHIICFLLPILEMKNHILTYFWMSLFLLLAGITSAQDATVNPYDANSSLQESGLLGPVHLMQLYPNQVASRSSTVSKK